MEESIDSLFKQLYSQEDSLSEHLIEIKLLNELKDMDLLKKYLKKLNDFNNSKNYKDVE